MYQYQESVNDKILMMKGLAHNLEYGMALLRSKRVTDFYAPNMIVNPFLCALIFELSIKGMWELSHSKSFGDNGEIKKHGHNTKSIYDELNQEFRENILISYRKQVDITRKTIAASGVQQPHFLSLDECLTENENIVKNAKYKFIHGSKINVVTCIIPGDVKSQTVQMSGKQPPFFIEDLIAITEDYSKKELNNV